MKAKPLFENLYVKICVHAFGNIHFVCTNKMFVHSQALHHPISCVFFPSHPFVCVKVCIRGCECLKQRSYQSCLSSRNQEWTNGNALFVEMGTWGKSL